MYIPVHHSAKIDENHHDHNQTDEGRGKVKSHHEKGHHENGNQGYSQWSESVFPPIIQRIHIDTLTLLKVKCYNFTYIVRYCS